MKEFDIEKTLPQPFEKLKIKTPLEEILEQNPFDYSKKNLKLFTESMKFAFEKQIKKSSFLRSYSQNWKYDFKNIKNYDDLDKFPFVFVNGFKERELLTKTKIVLELKSSGTSGQVSKIQLDIDSLKRVRRMAWQVFNSLGLCDMENEYEYICFTYDPNFANDIGTAWTDKLLTSFTKTKNIYYAFQWDKEKNNFYFDIENTLNKLFSYEKENKIVRLIGFPAFALKLTEEFKKKYKRYPKMNQKSSVITGGGWKTLSDEAIDKKIYRQILANNLGIKIENVRDLFGMVEHGVPYVDCEEGNFHIPIYGKVIVRDPITLENLGYNKVGLLQFMTPYLTSYPSLSILSSDLGLLKENCSCKRQGPILFIKGRAGVKKLKGCAISASQML